MPKFTIYNPIFQSPNMGRSTVITTRRSITSPPPTIQSPRLNGRIVAFLAVFGVKITSRSMLVHFLRALQFYSERNSGEARAGRSIYDASCARTGRTAKKNKAGFGGCTLSGRIVKRSGDGSAKKSGRGKEESWREGDCEHKKWQASRVEIENTGEGEIGGLADLMGGLGITGEKMDGLVDLMGGLGITGEKTDGKMDGLEFIREDGEEEIA